ncbi:MAG: glycosyltransferase [Planctomycetaceae bacterium]
MRICHPGSLYRKRDPRSLVEAIALLGNEGHDISFEQIGNCSPAFDLPSFARRLGVSDRVKVHAPVPHHEILRRMIECDVLLLLQPGTRTQVPGKLFEMVLTGKPILALTEEGATADLVQGYRLGAVARSDDPAGIAEAIKQCAQLVGSSDKSRRTAALEDFDGRTLTGRLAGVFDELRKDVRPRAGQSSERGVKVAAEESVG